MGSFPVYMSLLSQQDRQMVIEALEFYINDMKVNNCNEKAIYSYNTLLKWVELEFYKNEEDVMGA
jgi:hypothetical protein